MKKRLLSGIITALVLATSFNPSIISYAENDPNSEIIEDEEKGKEEEDKEEEDKEEEDKKSEDIKIDEDKDGVKIDDEKNSIIKNEEETDKDIKEFVIEGFSNGLKTELTDLEKMLSESKISTMAFSFAALPGEEERLQDKENIRIIDSIEVFKEVSGGSIPLTGDGTDVVATGDIISVKYNFKNSLTIVPDNIDFAEYEYDVISDREYDIPGIPSYCVRTSDESITVTNGNQSLGVVTFSDDGSAKFKVGSFSDMESAEGAFFQYDMKLDFGNLEDDESESFELAFGDTKIQVRVSDHMPKEPEVKKEASRLDDEGNITWTVTIQNDAKPIEYPDGYTFTDDLGEEQSFVADSFLVNGEEDTDTEFSVSDSTISWRYVDNNPSSKNVFTYRTHVDLLKLTKDAKTAGTVSKEVSNKITVTASNASYGDLSIEKTATVNAQKSVSEWVFKEGSPVDLRDGTSTWTVKIRNNGFKLSDVVLHDNILADSSTHITVSDIHVVDSSNNNVSFSFSKGEDGKESLLRFTKDMEGDAVYTVTYKTTIEDIDNYLKSNHSLPKNSAWVTYKYDPTGNGTGLVDVKGPTVEKPFEGIHSKAAVEVTAGNIDKTDHTMTWKIVANKSAQFLQDVTITDILPSGHEFVEISSATIGNAAFDTDGKTTLGTSTDGAKTVTIDLGNEISGKKAEIYVVTKLDNTQNFVWAGNKSQNYTNKVKLSSLGNTEVNDSVSKVYTSTVIKKNVTNSYDYDSHKIKYTITVNENEEMVMNDVTVTDQLIELLELETESISVTGSTEGLMDRSEAEKLEMHFDKIVGKVIITFSCKVKDGRHFSDTGEIKIENNASITSREYDVATVTNPGTTTTIRNTVLAKNASISTSDKSIVNYTVALNPARQQLYTGSIASVKIKDTLGASLVLDESSIKLFTGNVDSLDGNITKSTEIGNVNATTSKDGSKTILEVEIPKEYDRQAFVLTYSADVADLDANDLTNRAQLVGYGRTENNSAEKSFSSSQFSNVSFSKFTYVIAELKDEFDESVLEGGEFKLVDADSKALIGEKITGKNGKLTFVGKLQSDHDYTFIETKAPDGYLIPDELKTGVTVTAKGPGLDAAKNNTTTLYNKQPSVMLTIGDVSKEANKALTGAEFKLFKNTKLVKSWISESAAMQLEVPKGSYILKRTKQPKGYDDGEREISFDIIDENASKNGAESKLKVVFSQQNASENTQIDLASNKILVQEVKTTSSGDASGVEQGNNSGLPQIGMPGRGPLGNGGTGNAGTGSGASGTIDGSSQGGRNQDAGKEQGKHSSNDSENDHGSSSDSSDNSQNMNYSEYDNAVKTVNITELSEASNSENSENHEASDGQEGKTLSGARLKKTGGFVGTVVGYIAGIMLIIAGLLLISRKRKHV